QLQPPPPRSTLFPYTTLFRSLIRMNEIKTEVDKNNVEIASSSEQLGKLRKSLKGLSAEDQKTIDQKTKYDNEEAIIEDLKNQLRSEEHTSELQSRENLVCRLL